MNISTAHLQRLFAQQPPAGLSPIVYRNWLLGRYLYHKKRKCKDHLLWLEQAQAALLKTPLKGMALLLCRFFQAYPRLKNLQASFYWAHYRALLGVPNAAERLFYERCALAGHWTAGQLERQIRSQWLWRRQYQHAANAGIIGHETAIALPNPIVLDFPPHLNIHNEQQLESLLLDQLGVFLLELGPGFSFVARQQRLTSFSGKRFTVDLVFYHYRWRRFVLFELKYGPLNAAAIGQLETYVQLFDDFWKSPSDLPTLGVVLCRSIDPALLRYSALQHNAQLLAITFERKAKSEK